MVCIHRSCSKIEGTRLWQQRVFFRSSSLSVSAEDEAIVRKSAGHVIRDEGNAQHQHLCTKQWGHFWMLYYYSDGQFRQILKELLLSHEVVLCCSMGKRGQQDLLDFDYIDMYVPSNYTPQHTATTVTNGTCKPAMIWSLAFLWVVDREVGWLHLTVPRLYPTSTWSCRSSINQQLNRPTIDRSRTSSINHRSIRLSDWSLIDRLTR